MADLEPQQFNSTVMETYLSILVSWVNEHVCLSSADSPRVAFVRSTVLDKIMDGESETHLYACSRPFNAVRNVSQMFSLL